MKQIIVIKKGLTCYGVILLRGYHIGGVNIGV